MPVTTQPLRYQLPKKAIKANCPDCGPSHRKTLSRYVDTRTGEPLPEPYGRCDRESNCGFFLSPYAKGPSGMSYADQIYHQWKAENPMTPQTTSPYRNSDAGKGPETRFSISAQQNQPIISPLPITPVHCIPDEVFTPSIGHYERNEFARLLQTHFGMGVAGELLSRFQIGTSAHWPGGCVFWLKDEQERVRGGQVVLFDRTGHTVKKSLPDGSVKRCTSWVHYALATRYDQKAAPRPDWLTDYIEKANKFPIPFGLHQLRMAGKDQAVALVESPKTAILCTPYFPQFIWMAIGGLSYLKAERLSCLRMRKLVLFPDLNAYADRLNEKGQVIKGWQSRAQELQTEGFNVTISDYLEQRATDEEKGAGLDLADYLLTQWKGYPADWDRDTLDTPPVLTASPNREEFVRLLGVSAEDLPLYRLSRP